MSIKSKYSGENDGAGTARGARGRGRGWAKGGWMEAEMEWWVVVIDGAGVLRVVQHAGRGEEKRI